MRDEILTVVEVAQLLKVAERTVYTMAQNAEIPCFKVRGQWRFRKQDIDAWISEFVDRRQRSESAANNKRSPQIRVDDEQVPPATSARPDGDGGSLSSTLGTEGHRPQTRRPS